MSPLPRWRALYRQQQPVTGALVTTTTITAPTEDDHNTEILEAFRALQRDRMGPPTTPPGDDPAAADQRDWMEAQMQLTRDFDHRCNCLQEALLEERRLVCVCVCVSWDGG